MNLKLRKKVRNTVRLTLLNLVFIVMCLIALVPILYALSLSFSASGEALPSGALFSIRDFTLENYRAILFDEPFLTWLANSLILSAGTMLVAMFCGVFAAYAVSRWRFAGRWGMMNLLLILNAFPSVLSLFALFRVLKTLNLLNSHLGLVLIYAGTMCIFSIWNMKGYFDTIPTEIEEASKIDGASNVQMLWKIVLPLAKPAIIVTAVMVLISVWNEYLFATTFLLDPAKYSLAGGLYQLQASDYSRNWAQFSAAAMLVSLPILLVFFKIQKYMVSGLTAGGVKG
jgi:arabinogalactan oligomer/maltooligosaccharide transport system permease protein